MYLFLWQGDALQEALAALLQHQGLQASNEGLCLVIQRATRAEVMAAIGQIAAQPCPTAADILSRKHVRNSEKWDWVLPDALFFASYASRALALEEAVIWCQNSL